MDFAKLSPAQSNSNFSWLGWDSFNFNFYPPTHPPTPRESTELSSAQLNPTPTQLVGLIGSRISLKPAWAELGTAQSQLVFPTRYINRELLWKSHIFVKIAQKMCDFHQNVRFSWKSHILKISQFEKITFLLLKDWNNSFKWFLIFCRNKFQRFL